LRTSIDEFERVACSTPVKKRKAVRRATSARQRFNRVIRDWEGIISKNDAGGRHRVMTNCSIGSTDDDWGRTRIGVAKTVIKMQSAALRKRYNWNLKG
jgi:hypothetical protein